MFPVQMRVHGVRLRAAVRARVRGGAMRLSSVSLCHAVTMVLIVQNKQNHVYLEGLHTKNRRPGGVGVAGAPPWVWGTSPRT